MRDAFGETAFLYLADDRARRARTAHRNVNPFAEYEVVHVKMGILRSEYVEGKTTVRRGDVSHGHVMIGVSARARARTDDTLVYVCVCL